MPLDQLRKFRLEEFLFFLYIATISFATVVPYRVFGIAVQPSDLILVFTAGAWLAAIILRQRKVRLSWFHFCVALYAVAVFFSTITSANPGDSAVKLVGKVYLIFLGVITFDLVRSVGFLRKMSYAWLAGTAITVAFGLLGIILFYSGITNPRINIVLHPIFGSLPVENYPRIEGFYGYPAILCNYLSVSWMIAIFSFSGGWIRKRAFWLFTGAIWIVNVFTLTPGLGGFILGTGYFLYRRLKETQRYQFGRLILASSLIIALGFLFVSSFTFFAYSATGTKIPLLNGQLLPSHRAIAWETSFNTALENPVFGRGVGEPIAESRFIDPSGTKQLLSDAHNTYLSVLGETGMFGFLTFAAVIGFAFFSLTRWHPPNALLKTVRLCLLIAFLDAFFYQSLTGSYEDQRHLWVLFGLVSAVCRDGFVSASQEASSGSELVQNPPLPETLST
jgi:O-antigen ligase